METATLPALPRALIDAGLLTPDQAGDLMTEARQTNRTPLAVVLASELAADP